MNESGWIDTLQWTALFAAQMLAAPGPAAPLLLGGALTAGWVLAAPAVVGQSPRPGVLRRILRGLLAIVVLLLAAMLSIAWSSADRTGDVVLAAQLRALTMDSALGTVGGGGIVAAIVLLWTLRRRDSRPTQARRGQGV